MHEGVRSPLQRPSIRRRDYHNGADHVFFRLNLPLNKFCRQCYDGACHMSGQRTGVAKRIHELEPGQSNHILKATR